MKRVFSILILLMMVMVSGCVSLRVPKHLPSRFKVMSGAARQKQLTQIKHWSIRGAFSIVRSSKKPVLANYHWMQQSVSRYRIRVSSALDIFSLLIIGRPHTVRLVRSNQEIMTAKTPEQLLQKEMGWSLPIGYMYYWVRGLTAPGSKTPDYDRYGHLLRLWQQGWRIQFSNYITVNQYDLPEKMIMKHSGLRITIVMKQWKITK